MLIRLAFAAALFAFVASGALAQQLQDDAGSAARVKSWEQQLEDLRRKIKEDEARGPIDSPALRSLPNIEAWYLVQPDGSLKLHDGKVQARHEKQWNLLRKIVDRPIQEVYTTYVAFDMPEVLNKTTGASVAPTQLEPLRYGFAFNQIMYGFDAKTPDTVFYILMLPTFIHEYAGHTKVGASKNLIRGNGCLKKTLEINPQLVSFADTFWKHCDQEGKDVKRDPKEFPSDYAMVSVLEDFAESVSAFVMCREPQKTGNKVLAQRLHFFRKDPEWVKYRKMVHDAMRFDKMLWLMVKMHQPLPGKRCM